MVATMVRAIGIKVYRSNIGDCSNDGVSSKYDDLWLACDKGYIDIDENDEQLVKMVTRSYAGIDYKYIEPYKECPKGMIGWMFGGNVGYTSDNRFRSSYPLKIHDRCETQEEYDFLSQ